MKAELAYVRVGVSGFDGVVGVENKNFVTSSKRKMVVMGWESGWGGVCGFESLGLGVKRVVVGKDGVVVVCGEGRGFS